LDDDLRKEVVKKLSGVKRTNSQRENEGESEAWLRGDMKSENVRKARDKAEQRAEALKRQYEAEKKREITRKFANSSYLTPESISYLNDAVKRGGVKNVDQELVYAGLHSTNAPK
jgi:hypothetical protein